MNGVGILKKFDIIKTFEIFNTETINVIRERIIQFVLVEAENFFASKTAITAEITSDDTICFSVLNNEKVYNLLTNAWRKKQKRMENEDIKC